MIIMQWRILNALEDPPTKLDGQAKRRHRSEPAVCSEVEHPPTNMYDQTKWSARSEVEDPPAHMYDQLEWSARSEMPHPTNMHDKHNGESSTQ